MVHLIEPGEANASEGELPAAPRFHILTWCSRKLKRTVHSSFAAEAVESCVAADEAFFTKYLFDEVTGDKSLMFMVTDSMSLRDHVQCLANYTNTKRLRIDLKDFKEMSQKKE